MRGTCSTVLRVGPRQQLPGVIGGLLLTLGLHVAAIVLVLIAQAIVSQAHPGPEAGLATFVLFFVGLPLWQWLYVAPAALIARRAGFAALAKGLWIGGGLGVLLAGLWFGGMLATGAIASLMPARPAPTPDTRSVDVRGVVESLEGDVLAVRTDAGSTTLRVGSSTDYVMLKANGGADHVTRDSVTPGVRVSIDGWREPGREASAQIVRIVAEGRAMP